MIIMISMRMVSLMSLSFNLYGASASLTPILMYGAYDLASVPVNLQFHGMPTHMDQFLEQVHLLKVKK